MQRAQNKKTKIHRVRRAFFVAYSGAPPENGTGSAIFPSRWVLFLDALYAGMVDHALRATHLDHEPIRYCR
jgi:hypothetical protein